jgi:hypothetical protein
VSVTIELAGRLLTGTPHGRRLLRWAAGTAILVVLAPVILPAAVLSVFSDTKSAVEQQVAAGLIGSGTSISPVFVAIFNTAAQTFDVNPYLLASVADQESGFGTASGWMTVNSAGCVGFMQTCVGGRAGDSWDSTVTLTADPALSLPDRDAYRLASRPPAYPLESATHPSYDDPFDAVMAAAVELRGKVDGAPIPQLDQTAYQALCGYYGACTDPAANYAATVLARAKAWQAESALINAGGGPVPLVVPPGSQLEQLVAVANEIAAMRIPYCWGGGHATTPGPSPGSWCQSATGSDVFGDSETGLDCSGSVRWLLTSVGVPDPGPIASGDFGSWLQPGPGAHVDVYYNQAHVFITVDGRVWQTSDANYRGGPAWTAPRSTVGFTLAHPAGL